MPSPDQPSEEREDLKNRADNLLGELSGLIRSAKGIMSADGLEQQRVQLREVQKSIKGLERRAIPVPSKLGEVEASLAASLSTADEAKELLSIVNHTLKSLLGETKIANVKQSKAARNKTSRKPPSPKRQVQ